MELRFREKAYFYCLLLNSAINISSSDNPMKPSRIGIFFFVQR